jgi:hypothetical protein
MLGPGGFVILAFGCVALLVIALILLGRFYPGSAAEVLDWKPTRSAQLEAELEQNDIEQMLAAQNVWRRARGAPERTLEDLERDVAIDLREYREVQQRLGGAGAKDSTWPES